MTPEALRKELFSALEQERLDDVQRLAADYTATVKRSLAASKTRELPSNLAEVLRPLQEALRFLRISRAHKAERFKRLAVHNIYGSSPPASKGQRLRFQA